MSVLVLIIAAMHWVDQSGSAVWAGLSLAALGVVVGFCSLQKQRVAYLIATGLVVALAGVVAFGLGLVISAICHSPTDSLLFASLSMGVVAAVPVIALIALIVGSNKRRLGMLVGVVAAMVVGRSFMWLLPPDCSPNASADQMRFLVPLLPGLLFGLDLGWFFDYPNKQMWQRWAVSGAVVMICVVGLFLRAWDIHSGTYRAYSVNELIESKNARGLSAKVRSENGDIHWDASEALLEADGPEATAYRISVLKDRSHPRRKFAAYGLHARGDERWFGILAQDTQSPDPKVRREALECMSSLDFERSKPYVQAATKAPDAETRRLAELLLRYRGRVPRVPDIQYFPVNPSR